MDDITNRAYDLTLALATELPLGTGKHSFILSFTLERKVDERLADEVGLGRETIDIIEVDCRETPTDMEKLITVLYNTDQRLDLVEKMLARSVQK